MQTMSDIDSLLAALKPKIERALVASYGLQAGLDAAAHALVVGWEQADRILAMENPGGYLYVVGTNHAKRAGSPVPILPAVDVVAEPRIEPGIPDALATLSMQQRRAVVLHHCFEYSYSEIAEILDITVSSVRNHLSRGMTKLRHELGAEQ